MRVPLLTAGLIVLFAGCAAPGSVSISGSSAFIAPARPSDGLLQRADLQALVDLQVLRSADGLIQALASPDSVIRARAALALGSVQDAKAVPALQRLLDDPASTVRADIAFALGQTADSTSGVALVVSLRTESNPTVLTELLDALGKTGGHADLRAVLGTSLEPRMEAARAMAVSRFGIREITSPEASAWMADRMQSADPALRDAAAYLFTRAPVPAWRAEMPTIRNAFDGLVGDPARAHLARALARAEDATDVTRLVAALANEPDWRNRVSIASALGAFLTAGPARSALLSALRDPVPHVGVASAAALAQADDLPESELAVVAQIVADANVPWQIQAPLLPLLAQVGLVDAVSKWAADQESIFARAAATSALAAAPSEVGLEDLIVTARSESPLLSATAVQALRRRFAGLDAPRRRRRARQFYDVFADALRKRDLATTAAAAPILADSAFQQFGAGPLLREVYGQLSAPADVEPMVEIISAIGTIRDGDEIDFLLGITLNGHPLLRRAARDALNDRFVEGIDVTLSGDDPGTGTIAMDWTHLERVGRHPRLILETERGTVVIRLDTEAAPQTVQMLTRTSAGERYNGIPFHRVVPNFVVQGGDYFRMDGYGGPETPIRSELNRNRFRTGTAGMASAGKDTEGVQFFLTHGPTPHLDGKYTVFGEVISGREVVDSILQGDRILRARLVPDVETRSR